MEYNYEKEMDELSGLMKYSFSITERDNQEYVTNLGRRLNYILENMVETSIPVHKSFLNELETLFRTVKSEYIDGVNIDEQYEEYPRLLAQLKHIREMIRNFLSTTGEINFILKFKYRFAKQALIHLYFMSYEVDNSALWNNANIHDYERPVTFYEYDINSLVESMEEL